MGPIYDAHEPEEAAALLGAAYRSSLAAATAAGVASIAFPAISCGVYGYPFAEAAEVSLAACREATGGDGGGGSSSLREVHFFLFGDRELDAWREEAERTLQPVPPAEAAEEAEGAAAAAAAAATASPERSQEL